jgi:hypothetical protein
MQGSRGAVEGGGGPRRNPPTPTRPRGGTWTQAAAAVAHVTVGPGPCRLVPCGIRGDGAAAAIAGCTAGRLLACTGCTARGGGGTGVGP